MKDLQFRDQTLMKVALLSRLCAVAFILLVFFSQGTAQPISQVTLSKFCRTVNEYRGYGAPHRSSNSKPIDHLEGIAWNHCARNSDDTGRAAIDPGYGYH